MKSEDIEKQFDDWFQFLNSSSVTIGFLSGIAALCAESIPLLVLSFAVWVAYIEYNKKSMFPKFMEALRSIEDGDSEFIRDIKKQAERKFTLLAILKSSWLYWGMVCIYVVGIIILLSCPSVLLWH
ncbi:MAG: hypothetical protein AB7C98_01125 [Acidithiobacillus sp.]